MYEEIGDQVDLPPPKCTKVDDHSVSTRVVIMVRHGEYDKKISPDLQKLTLKGTEQVQCTAKAIKKMPNRPTIFQVESSSLLGAKKTAAIIHSSLSCNARFTVDGLLNEGDLKDECALEQFNTVYQNYLVVPMPGHAKTEVVVCHGNIICYFIAR